MDTVNEIISDLQRFYGQTMGDPQVAFYRTEMLSIDEDDLCAAAIAVKAAEPMTDIPTIVTIRKYVADIREKRLQREKAQTLSLKQSLNKQRTAHGRKAISIMIDLYDGKLTREQYLSAMEDMEKEKPGIGWREAAGELRRTWARDDESKERRERERKLASTSESNENDVAE